MRWEWPGAVGTSVHYGGRRDAGAAEFWVDRRSFRDLEYSVELGDPQQFAHLRSWIEKLKIDTRGLERDQTPIPAASMAVTSVRSKAM